MTEKCSHKPAKCSHKTETIRFRVATKDRKIMEAAAKRVGLGLSEWMRQTLLLAAADGGLQGTVAKKIDASWQDKSAGVRPSGPDPDKLAAFQKRAGMGGVKR